ncbi:MAG: T9SS type A sorting domain-containing protein [Bacteroidia bacterium]|nr:T9SS type A sorting domain-containing protein [Bacteroidia bacterium]
MKSLTTCIALFVFALPLFGQNPGDLDESFGSSGFVYLNNETDTAEYLMDVICLRNDKIIMAGYINHLNSFDLLFTKLNKNGSVDHTFGDNGYTTIDLNSGSSDKVERLIELPDGKLLVVGSSYSNSVTDGFILRLNPDGSIDKSFGVGSKGYTLFNAGAQTSCRAKDLELFNGSVYVAASTYSDDNGTDFSVFKFTQAGALDQSFASKGSTLLPLLGNDDLLSMDMDKSGRFLLGGVSVADGIQYGAVAKLNQFGLPTSTFGGKGYFTYDKGSGLNTIIDVQFDNEERMVAAGSEGKNPDKNGMIFRFLSDGTPDSTFSNDGVQTSDIGLTNGVFINRVMVEKNNSVIALGYLKGPSYKDVYALKLKENGSPDFNFGSKGDINHPVSLNPSYLFFKAAAKQSDGNIVLAGTTTIKDMDAFNMSVVRLHNTEDSVATSGTTELRSGTALSVYPNPMHSAFSIELASGAIERVELTDMVGNHMVEWGPEVSYSLPTDMVCGLYLLRVNTANGTYCKRVLVH